jgi:hypothetical protein
MSGLRSSEAQKRLMKGTGTFPNTRWSVVLAARGRSSPESAAALEAICRAYWYPLYAYVRRHGHSAHDAQDVTQEFFYRMLEKRWLDAADRDKGKLRTFLIVALRKFMSKENSGEESPLGLNFTCLLVISDGYYLRRTEN